MESGSSRSESRESGSNSSEAAPQTFEEFRKQLMRAVRSSSSEAAPEPPEDRYTPVPEVLTRGPKEGVYNDKHDNECHDYICRHSHKISSPEGEEFELLELLGSGSYGQVLQCKSLTSGEMVAVKIAKNTPSRFENALREAAILQTLARRFDLEENRLVHMIDCFVYRKHVCMLFEMLGENLYVVLKQRELCGLSFDWVRNLTEQLLRALQCLGAASIIHTDVKPENIVLANKRQIRLIDFGMSCFEHHQLYTTNIGTRYYRSPEVMLGLKYTCAIDMWSLGCVCAELWMGFPIFPGRSGYEQLHRFDKILGPPPDHMIETGTKAQLYFCKLEVPSVGNCAAKSWRLKTVQEFGLDPETSFMESIPESSSLADLIRTAEEAKDGDKQAEEERSKLSHFLAGVLQIDPDVRWKPHQCLENSFIQGRPFDPDFQPQAEADDDGTPSSAWKTWAPPCKEIAIEISCGEIAGGDITLNKTLHSFCSEFDPPPRSKAQVVPEIKAEDDMAPFEGMLEN